MRRFLLHRALMVFIAVAVVSAQQASFADPPDLPVIAPEAAGMQTARLNRIDDIVADGLNRNRMPGCVVMIGRREGIVLNRAYGFRQTQPEPVPMANDTVFDLASLTKPIATATSVMVLIERGLIELDAPVARYIPDFAANGKDVITIRQLLVHQGGLIPDNGLSDYNNGPEQAMQHINNLQTSAEPGTRFVYSDVGFIVLAEVVRRVTDHDVHRFSHETIFGPLGMGETGFLPDENLRERAAVTEQRDGHWMRGEVHDPRAYRLGGIAGHAGLFSTARDLSRFAVMMLNHGSYEGVVIMNADTAKRMTTAVPVSSGLRGLGWDMRTGYSTNRGDLLSTAAFGHGGFTGTAIWIDPEQNLFVIFLSNRVHPDGKGAVNDLAGRIATVAAAAINPAPALVSVQGR